VIGRSRQNLRRLLAKAWHSYLSETREVRNLEPVLHAAVNQVLTKTELGDPHAFVEYLRSCFEPLRYDVIDVKIAGFRNTAVFERFDALVGSLKSGVAPIDYNTALEFAMVMDRYLSNRPVPETVSNREGQLIPGILDIGYHVPRGSSGPKKGRLLSAAVRFGKPRQCLELGTYYGMSGLFILSAQQANGVKQQLTTLEGFEPRISYSSRLLRDKYGESVEFLHGMKKDKFPGLLEAGKRFDFMFHHDAGHLGQDYVNDWKTLSPILSPGAIIVFDDIRWDKMVKASDEVRDRINRSTISSHEAWLQVVADDRVQYAVEVDQCVGVMLLK
jgi:predicted O-methyltransferase YrrM